MRRVNADVDSGGRALTFERESSGAGGALGRVTDSGAGGGLDARLLVIARIWLSRNTARTC